MAKYITCIDDFNIGLGELNTILYYAKRNQRNRDKYLTFIKSSVILLVSKFEAFLEDSVSDYIKVVENWGLKPSDFPEVLKLYCMDKLIDEKFISNVRKHKSKALVTVERISKFCYGKDEITNVDIDTQFDYGKHGESAITKLFARIGITNVFESCIVYEKKETLAGAKGDLVPVSIVADINALTNIRNNILHGDATPSLTHGQVENYKRHITMFSEKVVEKLEEEIDNLVGK